MIKIKTIFLTTFALIFFNFSAFSEDIISKEINKVKSSLTETANTSKIILTPPKIAKNKIENALSKINSECCAENFKYKKDLIEIKNVLENCISEKCQNYIIPLFNVKKPPLKVIALKQISLVDDLLIENEKQKYNNLIEQMELNISEKENKNEKDLISIQNQLLEKEKENKKLKKTVNKLLANYEKKIVELKKENQIVEDNFNLVFEAHSKAKQKKLSKRLK